MIPLESSDLLAPEGHNPPKRYREHGSLSEDENDSYCINGSRNLTIRLDDSSDISQIQNQLELFRQSDEEQKRINVIGVAVAEEFENRKIKRKIIVDCSMNITLDFRKDRSRPFVDTCLVDDEEDEE